MNEMKKVNLDDLSLEEMRELQDRIEKDMHERTKKEQAQKRKQMKDLAKELGYTVHKIPSPGKGKGRGRPKQKPTE